MSQRLTFSNRDVQIIPYDTPASSFTVDISISSLTSYLATYVIDYTDALMNIRRVIVPSFYTSSDNEWISNLTGDFDTRKWNETLVGKQLTGTYKDQAALLTIEWLKNDDSDEYACGGKFELTAADGSKNTYTVKIAPQAEVVVWPPIYNLTFVSEGAAPSIDGIAIQGSEEGHITGNGIDLKLKN